MPQRMIMEDVMSPGDELAKPDVSQFDPRQLFGLEQARVDTSQPRMFVDAQYSDWRRNFEQARARRTSFTNPVEYDQWFRSTLDTRAPMMMDRLKKDYFAAMPDDLKAQVMGRAREIAARRQAAPVVNAFRSGEMGAPTPSPGATTVDEFNSYQKGRTAKMQADEAAQKAAQDAAQQAAQQAAADRADKGLALNEREQGFRESQTNKAAAVTEADRARITDYFENGPGKGKSAPWSETDANGVVTYYNPITREIRSYQKSVDTMGQLMADGGAAPAAPTTLKQARDQAAAAGQTKFTYGGKTYALAPQQ